MSEAGEPGQTESRVAILAPQGAFELAGVVEAVRAQLAQAVAEADGKRLRFDVGDVELECTVVLTSEAKINGGIKVWVVNVGRSVGETETTTHRIKIQLRPVDAWTGESPRISDTVEEIPPR